MKFGVFEQRKPIDTGEALPAPYGGTWHRANLKKVGEASTWEEAKKLTPHPLMESNLKDTGE